MRIMFDDDRGRRVAMECTSVAAIPDTETDGGWAVVASGDRNVIIRTDLDEKTAKCIVRKLFDVGSYTSWTHQGQ